MQFSKLLMGIINFSFYTNLSGIANLVEISLRDPFGAEQSFIPIPKLRDGIQDFQDDDR